jgi:hypothetical protein
MIDTFFKRLYFLKKKLFSGSNKTTPYMNQKEKESKSINKQLELQQFMPNQNNSFQTDTTKHKKDIGYWLSNLAPKPMKTIRYSWDSNLLCRETFQLDANNIKDGQYIINFLKKRDYRDVIGVEHGLYRNGKKNGTYRRFFYNLYLYCDLPEVFLWETSPEFRQCVHMEEIGTYVNDKKEGEFIIKFIHTRNYDPSVLLCEEKGQYKKNKKYGEFTRTYYNEKLWNDLADSDSTLFEYGVFKGDNNICSIMEKKNKMSKLIYRQKMEKRAYTNVHYYTHRTDRSCLRNECKYTIESEKETEEGIYSYGFYDLQFFLCRGGRIWRRGSFCYEKRFPNYTSILTKICHEKQLPMELDSHINSFVQGDRNKRSGCFYQDMKLKSSYTKKGYLSDNKKYICIPNIYDSFEKDKKTIIFEKTLLCNSCLFDTESFCLIDTFQIRYTTAHSKFFEPIFVYHRDSDETPKSVLRFLFNRKGFKGYIIFENGNRNFITKDNVRFISMQEFSTVKDTVTTLNPNPNFHSR